MNERTAAEILGVVNRISETFRSTVTEEERAALAAREADEPEVALYAAGSAEDAMIEFSIDAMRTVIDDIDSVLDGRLEALYRQALDVYYAAEELARDPEHADVAAQVEAMRAAHEREYGCAPPLRDE